MQTTGAYPGKNRTQLSNQKKKVVCKVHIKHFHSSKDMEDGRHTSENGIAASIALGSAEVKYQ